MRPVAPRVDGIDEETIGGNNEQYLAITVGLAPTDSGGSAFVTRWRLSDEDRDAILRGEDIFITQMHARWIGDPALRFVPLKVSVGIGDLMADPDAREP